MRRARFDLITRINEVVADARDTAERVRRFLQRPSPSPGADGTPPQDGAARRRDAGPVRSSRVTVARTRTRVR